MNKLAIIIPSRDLHGILRACLGAVERAVECLEIDTQLELLIVDNASIRPYVRVDAPGANIIRFDTHQTFSRCCNYAANLTKSRHLLFLNNDVILAERALESMLQTLESKDAGIVGTLLEFPSGKIQHAGVGFPSATPVNMGRDKESAEMMGTVTPVPAVTGAAMLVRRDVFTKLGGFNEQYPFGHEDVDFCLRARSEGNTIWLDCRTRSLHFESLTPGRSTFEEQSRMHFLSIWRDRIALKGDTQ